MLFKKLTLAIEIIFTLILNADLVSLKFTGEPKSLRLAFLEFPKTYLCLATVYILGSGYKSNYGMLGGPCH